MHTAALEAMGLAPEWSYEAIDVSADEFERLVRELPARGYAGVNVTVPHKVRALAVADGASAAADAIGAANTLSFADGGIYADNTDAAAIAGSVPSVLAGERTLVLGAGGSARAAAWALKDAGASVHIWNRSSARARLLASELELIHEPDPEGVSERTRAYRVIVNATTIGMGTAHEDQPPDESGLADLKALPLAVDDLDVGQVVIDLAYGATDTELSRSARRAGARVVDGLDVLALQGAASLRLWTDVDPPLETMRAAARAA
ncbi:shikimate dehydrogenase [soil metagenome]